MKILLLYQFGNHAQMIDNLIIYLNKNIIEADSFNIVNWQFQGGPNSKLPVVLKILKPFINIPKIRGILLILFQQKIIADLSNNYQLIDIHFFSTNYDKIIPHLIEQNKRIKITIWGSDFYRASKRRIEEQRQLFGLVNSIQVATTRMGMDFLEKFPEYSSKIRYAHFGMQQFDLMKEFDNPEELHKYRHSIGIPDDKIIISCGYNGSSSQQHLIIIDSIAILPEPMKKSVLLLFQMTYGLTAEYLNQIIDHLKKTGLSYLILSDFLTKKEVAKLRLITDIAINISISDAYSASVQEQIYAENIVITGNWLPYDYLKNASIYFIETNIEELVDKISDCLKNIETCKSRLINNRDKIYKVSSWESSIMDWVHIYREIMNG